MEWLALSIGIGLVVSLLFTEAFGLGVGGMIVPGYLALWLDEPATIVATLAAALLTSAAVHWLDRWAILFGRRRVVLTMVLGFAVAAALRGWMEAWFPLETSLSMSAGGISWSGVAEPSLFAGMTVIGFVIPGLVALWIARTGVVQTLSPLLVASVLVHLVLIAAGVEIVA